ASSPQRAMPLPGDVFAVGVHVCSWGAFTPRQAQGLEPAIRSSVLRKGITVFGPPHCAPRTELDLRVGSRGRETYRTQDHVVAHSSSGFGSKNARNSALHDAVDEQCVAADHVAAEL